MACLRYLLQSHRVPITIVIAFLLLDATRAMNTTTSIVARPDPHVTSAAAQATSATELTPQWTTAKLSLWYGAISFGILGAMASFCVFMLVCLGIICAPKSVEPGAPPELDRTLV
ncbi:hypothetical protein AAVH_05077 [Aphelenchoides avenae]|nr:hypothetical protein AAVH_05077 [Aphelenchus avenae]